MDLIEIPADEVPRDDISLIEIRKKAKVTKRDYEVEQKEVSKNIQKFDKRPRVYTEDPYSYNSASAKKVEGFTPTASSLIANSLYNQAGKILGVDTVHDWNTSYDKVYEIVEWAKKKNRDADEKALLRFIYNKLNKAPSLGTSKMNDLYIFAGVSQ